MTMSSLPERVAALESSEQARFRRLFATSVMVNRPSPGAIVDPFALTGALRRHVEEGQ
jgi:hypothetical protein